MDIAEALDFIRENKVGTIATLRPDGRAHLSVVVASIVGEELWISLTQDRVKTKNLRGDPRCSMAFGIRPWVAVEGTAVLHDGDDVAERLRTYYRAASGEHPDWDDFDRAMREENRLIAAIVPERAYGS